MLSYLTLTIQKLISIVKMNGSYEITTNELANHLGVTVRNANRILRNLENGGAARLHIPVPLLQKVVQLKYIA